MKKIIDWSLTENRALTLLCGQPVTNGLLTATATGWTCLLAVLSLVSTLETMLP